ncbi:hypothetical protein PYW07_011780 [Mythimna separata]|uniref:BPTI/Kunitz inhibitor domain-containing protein n=1 Tax=Mythimna separata TaxID=271217 RepID=A0AAD7Y763_MYTSE|nr:hypothetical protein PYW07_011780 [Mythimna separata]
MICYVNGAAIDVLVPKSTDYRCKLPIQDKSEDGEVCLGYMRVYGYDSVKKRCVSFIYGGCGGNENRFFNRNQCERHCMKNKTYYSPRIPMYY